MVVLVITMPPREARDRRFRDGIDHIVVAAKQPCLFHYTYAPKQAAHRKKERAKEVEVDGIYKSFLDETTEQNLVLFLILSPARYAVDE